MESFALRVLKTADYREQGIRRWDIGEQICLFCSVHEAWHDGPQLYEGWTLQLDCGNDQWWAVLDVTRAHAREILTTYLEEYGLGCTPTTNTATTGTGM
jgi:hypothetical protein